MKFYIDQGITTLKGYDRFYVGNIIDMGTVEKDRSSGQGTERREALM